MPTPRAGYFLADGTRVPGVTTILSRFKESGALMYWAWEQGKAGKDFRETSAKAADAGTLAHLMVERHLKGEAPEAALIEDIPQDVRDKATNAFLAFLEWADQTNLMVDKQELQLVSEKYRFGGTMDACVLSVKGKRAIGDWKTSNGLYPDYLVQVAAYGGLYTEHFPGDPIVGGYHILRFSKQHGDFHHHYFPDLSTGWKQFLLLREAYELDRELKARAK